MKPQAFDYIRVETLPETLDVLAGAGPDAKVLAGGQSLVPLLNMRLAAPSTLVDINRLEELRTLARPASPGDTLEVGALVRQRQLERQIAGQPRERLIAAALGYIGHPQTRNQGTVGGSLAHADPSAELPLVLRTLGGTVVAQSVRGEREIPAEAFFESSFTTTLAEDELLTRIRWRLPVATTGVSFQEFRRRHGDFAVVAAACTMTLDGGGAVGEVRLGLGGVTDVPLLAGEVDALSGERFSLERAREVVTQLAERLDLADDPQVPAAYRRQLVTVLALRALDAAHQDAQARQETHATDVKEERGAADRP
jgi:CO/xanthine dehydrogenase FAD-binding subunit